MRRWALLLAVTAAAAGGCAEPSRVSELEDQLVHRDRRIAELREELAAREAELAAKQDQITRLQDLGDKRLDRVFHVDRVEIGRYTGGYKGDADSGHAGVRVYLRPIDRHGSVLKAAGDVTVQLFDLAEPPEASLITECRYPADEISRYWTSGFVTYHYVFECPWPQGPPKRREITVRVQFLDYLTGEQFSAQRVVTVDLPHVGGQ